MALADLLTSDGDVAGVKMDLTRTLHILAEASEEYAKASLGAANVCLEVAMEGGPCAQAYSAYAEISKYDQMSKKVMGSLIAVKNLLMNLHESDDDLANEAYSEHLREMSKINQTSALLEGASRRMELVNKARPSNPSPAARFNSAIFNAQEAPKE